MGQLTNLYVSESYQGLLKLTDSTTGLTPTLQTVQDGLGGNSPLQISQTQVNISGTFTVNGAPVGGADTGSLMKTGSVAGNVLTFTKGDGSTFNLQVDTGSVPSGTISGSQQIIDLGFATTSSVNQKLDTGSFNSYTSSNDSKVNSLISQTGSYVTETESGSFMTTGSVSGNVLTFTKGDGSQFNLTVDTGSVTPINTGSFATTGSNIFIGNQTISGSLLVSGSEVVTGPLTASRLQINGVTDLNGVLDVSNDATFRGNVIIQSSGEQKLLMRSTSGGGVSQGFDLLIQTSSFIIRDETHDFNFLEFDYNSGTTDHTLKLRANRFELNSGSLDVSGSLTASLQEGYVWIGGTGNISTAVPTSSFIEDLSIYTTTASFNAYTSSNDAKVNDLISKTGSYVTETESGSFLVTGSVAGNVLTFTKGDGTTFNLSVDTGSAASINTGSFATTGSNIFKGNQVISGSLIGNTLNNGMIFIGSEAYESGSVKANISASAAISQSNIFFGGQTGPAAANQTGSIVISGSNNIFMGGPRPNTLVTAGTYGYSNGALNIQAGAQTLNTASVYRPTTNSNINMSSIAMAFTSGALAVPSVANNAVFNSVTINHQSASINYLNNINNGAVTSTANNIRLPFLTTIQQNYFGAATNTINHISSSVTMINNITAGGSLTVTNLVSSSVSATANGLGFNNNIIGGNAVGIWVSGSNPTNRRTVTGNLLGGGATSVTASAVGSEFSSLQNSVVWGQNLIVSGTHPANSNGGSSFFGRFNDATTLHTSNEIVFAVGTGTGTGTRRTGFWITSGSIVGVSGSLIVSGGLDVSGGITGAIAIPNYVITTGSLAGTQTILGTLRISGSSPLQIGYDNVGLIKTYGGSNWLYRNTNDYNTVVGNVQGLNAGFFAGSEKNMVFNGFFSPFATGSNNTIIAGAGNDFISGSNNIFIGAHNGHAGGSGNIIIGGGNYSSGSIFDNRFELSTGNGTNIFRKDGTNALQIADDVQVTGSLLVSNSATITGSVNGNVNNLTVASNTASLNLNDGNFFVLQLTGSQDIRVEPSNIKAGQTINIKLNTTGSGTVSFPTSVKQVSGSAYVPSTGTTTDIITLVSFDSSNLFLANVKNLI